jgi:hypothetical protein
MSEIANKISEGFEIEILSFTQSLPVILDLLRHSMVSEPENPSSATCERPASPTISLKLTPLTPHTKLIEDNSTTYTKKAGQTISRHRT